MTFDEMLDAVNLAIDACENEHNQLDRLCPDCALKLLRSSCLSAEQQATERCIKIIREHGESSGRVIATCCEELEASIRARGEQ